VWYLTDTLTVIKDVARLEKISVDQIGDPDSTTVDQKLSARPGGAI
jgi:hypothetical protein